MTKKEDNTINLSDKKVKFWTDQINEETAEKKRDLERELEKKVDDDIDSKVSSFMKELKLDKLYKDHETNDKNLQDFLNQKDICRAPAGALQISWPELCRYRGL